jgi:hypothetical protein
MTTREQIRTTRRERRIAIAKDVLAQLNTLHLRNGTYMTGEVPVGLDDDAQKVIDIIQAECDVCLLGACLLSKIRLYDEVSTAQLMFDEDAIDVESSLVRDLLADEFSQEQMDLIEAAFERTVGLSDELDINDPELSNACLFGCRYEAHAARVQAIMENIVKHNGAFVPGEQAWTVAPNVVVETVVG